MLLLLLTAITFTAQMLLLLRFVQGSALVTAGLMADGITEVTNAEHVLRLRSHYS